MKRKCERDCLVFGFSKKKKTITVNELSFPCEHFFKGSQEPRRREYCARQVSSFRVVLINNNIEVDKA